MAKEIKKQKIMLRNVRLSFANIFEPSSFNGGPARYSANFLISKEDTGTINFIKQAMAKSSREEFGDNAPKFKSNQLCLRDGDEETWEGYANHMFLSSGNRLPVRIVDEYGVTITDGSKPQSGDYVNAAIEIWAQNNDFGKRLNANLVGVQFVKEGPRFGKTLNDDSLFAETSVKKEENALLKAIEQQIDEDEKDPFSGL